MVDALSIVGQDVLVEMMAAIENSYLLIGLLHSLCWLDVQEYLSNPWMWLENHERAS